MAIFAGMRVDERGLIAQYRCEWNDPSSRTHAVFENPPLPADGLFRLSDTPGLGLVVNEAELAKRRVPVG